jgi:hypothetical protein
MKRKNRKCNVSYIKTAHYEDFDTTEIANRDTDNIKMPISPSEKTRMIRFIQPTQVKMMEKTCDDQTLPAVRHVNQVLA